MMNWWPAFTILIALSTTLIPIVISSSSERTANENTTSITNSLTSSVSTASGISSSPPTETTVSGNAALPSSIRILLTSDIEYNIFPVHSENHSVCLDVATEEEQITADCVGGLSRLVRYVDENRDNYHLVLDAGNVAGQTYFPELKFNPLTRAIQRLNFTAVAVDAELFVYGADAMQNGFLSDIADATVAANLDMDSVVVEKSRTLKWSDECDVAVIGVVSKNRIEELSVSGVNANDEVSAVQQELKNLVNQSSKAGKLITIVIGTIDENTTNAIANLEGVDVIIVSGGSVSDSDAGASSLYSVTYQGSAYVAILQRNENFSFVLGSLELMIDESICNVTDVEMVSEDYSLVNQTDDAAVIQLEKEGMARLYQMTSSSLAVSTATITTAGCDVGECVLGNLVTDAVVSQLMLQMQDASRLAVYPSLRFSNNTQLSTDITGTAIDSLFESDEFLYSLVLSAPDLKSLLEESVSGGISSFLQISALMHVQFNLGQSVGSRVTSVQVVSGDAVAFSTVNLTDSTATYNITVPASMLGNNSILQDIPRTFHLLSVSEAVKVYLSRVGTLVAVPAGNRMTYTVNNPTPQPTCVPTTAPTPSPVTLKCPNNTSETVLTTLLAAAVCVGGAVLFWWFVMPRIRLYRARRDSSLPLVVR